MKPLPSSVLTRMQSGANDTMLDTCIINRLSEGANNRHGKPSVSYTPDGQSTQCGVKIARRREGLGDAVMADYDLRLPHGTSIGVYDRIQLTQAFNNADFTPVMCEIVGEIGYGETAVTIKLKRLTHGE